MESPARLHLPLLRSIIHGECFALKNQFNGENAARRVDSQQPCTLQDDGDEQSLYAAGFAPCFPVSLCFNI
jgi:hypothetical protein